MARAETTRLAALEMIPWLLARRRTADAKILLDTLAATGGSDPASELTARLHVVSAGALVPPPTLPPPDPEEVSRR
jgi:hypothetical protein